MLRLLLEWTAWLLGQRQAVRVAGASMLPTLHDGDVVLIRSRSDAPPPVGSVVVFRHKNWGEGLFIKRVASHGQAHLSLCSDNPLEGTDSRHLGPVPFDADFGIVTTSIPRWMQSVIARPHRSVTR